MAPRKSSRIQNQDVLQSSEVLIISDDEDVNTMTSNRRKRRSRSTQNNNSNSRRQQRNEPPTISITSEQAGPSRAAHRRRGSAGSARRQSESARTVRGQARRARGHTRTPRGSRPRRRVAQRPVVVNLDVTYSESSDDDDATYSDSCDVEDITRTRTETTTTTTTTSQENTESFLNIKNNRCSISDSDEDIVPDFYSKNTVKNEANGDSDSETEIYKVDYKAERWKALEEVKEMIEKETLEKKEKKIAKKKNKISQSILSDVESTPSKEDGLNYSVEANADEPSMNSSLDLNVDVSAVVLKGGAKVVRRTSKKTKSALASLQLFSKKLEKDAKLNSVSNDYDDDDDDIIMADNFKVTFRVCWGTSYTRHVVDRNSTFANFYQEIADKHQVSVSQVVLSFKDSLVSPELCPKDIDLSTGDILEGGILQDTDKNYSSQKEPTEGEISLKVQTANRKIVHTVSMSKYDKMSILMEKYSKLRNIALPRLRFKFDGESLEPTDTPSSLDLEGDECIDVFEL